MIGCPSREQLSSLIADRTGEKPGSEIGAHLQSCPKCREFLAALARDGKTGTGTRGPDDGETIEQTAASASDLRAIACNPAQIVDGIDSAYSPAETDTC